MASSCIPEECSRDLPPEVLGLVIAGLPNPADHARLRAACRSWRSAARQHARPQLPWIVLGGGHVFTPSDGRSHRLPSFPDDGICIGSTDGWLALALGDTYYSDHAYRYRLRSCFLLHNTFSGKSVPLTALDGIIVGETCKIRKFLMRSTPDDLIAVVTDNVNYPLVVLRQGRGAWLPERGQTRYKYIIDVAFLGDTLYTVTWDEDLIPLDLGLDGNGAPMVITARVINPSPGYDGYNAWSTDDDDNDDDEEEEDDDDEGVEEEEENSDDEAITTDEEEGDNGADGDDDAAASNEGDGSHNLNSCLEYTSNDEMGESIVVVSRHLMESRGKLLLVRQHTQKSRGSPPFTRRVDVLEADLDSGRWVPLPVQNGLGGDRALFISTYFSKFVSAPHGEVEADVVYNINTGQAFDFKSQTCRGPRFCKPSQGITWLFPLDLVL